MKAQLAVSCLLALAGAASTSAQLSKLNPAAYQNLKFWIDPDTPAGAHMYKTSFNQEYVLVASDEFNKDNRRFENGKDKMWTALDQPDVTNEAQEYMSPDAVTTYGGALRMTMTEKAQGGKLYTGAHIQSWNKFCFTGGVMSIRANMPKSEGVWPALWTIGNLGRAQFEESTKNVWPFSYNSCDEIAKKQQKINACNANPGHGLNPNQGRGAPEIDLLEGWTLKPEFVVMSYQVAPSIPFYYRPETVTTPVSKVPNGPGSWYRGITMGPGARNTQYYGNTDVKTYFTDAVTASYDYTPQDIYAWNVYVVEWVPGDKGLIKMFFNDKLIIGMTAESLGKYCDPTNATLACTQQRLVPEEPLTMIINFAMGSATSWAGGPEKTTLPAVFSVDYVRIYQPVKQINIGCDPPKYPTRQYIKDFQKLYGPPVTPMPPADSSFHFYVGSSGSNVARVNDKGQSGGTDQSNSPSSHRFVSTLSLVSLLSFVVFTLLS